MITSTEFLSSAASDERDIAGDLAALQGELGVLQGQLVVLEQDLRAVESERLEAKDAQEQAMLADQAAWEKLSGECARSKSSSRSRSPGPRQPGVGEQAECPRQLLPDSDARSPVRHSPIHGATPAREGGPIRAPT